jgi:VanZ family protein
MKHRDSPVSRWTAAAAYAGLIAFLSHQPTLPAPGIPNIDKVFHAGEYAVLAFLLGRAVFPSLRRRPLPERWGLVVLACLLYAISDEMHQAFIPGRSCDPADMAADAAGAVLTALFFGVLPRHLRRRLLSIDS